MGVPGAVGARVKGEPVGGQLAEAVALAAAGRTAAELARATGLTPRTVRQILDPHTARRFTRATLAALDEPLAWTPGTAWRIYWDALPALPPADIEDVDAELRRLSARVAEIEARPDWVATLVMVCRDLDPADAELVLAIARRLGARRS